MSAAMYSKSKAWMEKMGWKEGMGLGKNNDGIKKYVGVTKKDDTAGLGVDKFQWDDMWWDNMYKKAAQNITPGVIKEEVKEEKVEVKTDNLYYGSFTKTTTLQAESSSDSEGDGGEIEGDALFKKCEGRLLRRYVPEGKLKRLASQNSKFINGEKVLVPDKPAIAPLVKSPKATPTKKQESEAESDSESDEDNEEEKLKKEKKRAKKEKKAKKAKKESAKKKEEQKKKKAKEEEEEESSSEESEAEEKTDNKRKRKDSDAEGESESESASSSESESEEQKQKRLEKEQRRKERRERRERKKARKERKEKKALKAADKESKKKKSKSSKDK